MTESVEKAITRTPAGDRVRKGFQAIPHRVGTQHPSPQTNRTSFVFFAVDLWFPYGV